MKEAQKQFQNLQERIYEATQSLYEFLEKENSSISYSIEDEDGVTTLAISSNFNYKEKDKQVESEEVKKRKVFKPLSRVLLFIYPYIDWFFHFVMGLYCGYPLCCVLYFCISGFT